MNLKTGLFVLFLLIFAIAINAQTNIKVNIKKTEEVTFNVSMHCQSCKERIEKAIPMEKGVKDIKVDLEKKEVTLVYNPTKTTEEKLKKAIEELGYTCKKTKSVPE